MADHRRVILVVLWASQPELEVTQHLPCVSEGGGWHKGWRKDPPFLSWPLAFLTRMCSPFRGLLLHTWSTMLSSFPVSLWRWSEGMLTLKENLHGFYFWAKLGDGGMSFASVLWKSNLDSWQTSFCVSTDICQTYSRIKCQEWFGNQESSGSINECKLEI